MNTVRMAASRKDDPSRDHVADEHPIQDSLGRLADAEASLASHTYELEHLQRLATVGTLAAGIVHEINNQLTPALAKAQLARLSPDEPGRMSDAVDQCIRAITHAGRIADSLVSFASPEEWGEQVDGQPKQQGGHISHQYATSNVAQVFKTALTCLAGIPDRSGIRISSRIPPSCWVAIEPLALQQILVNLLLNAVKAMETTQNGIINVDIHIYDDQIELIVEDNGPGIAPSMRDRLFSPFATARATRSSAKGRGLGLAISRRLVEAANGSIEAGVSDELGGAAFTVRLKVVGQFEKAGILSP